MTIATQGTLVRRLAMLLVAFQAWVWNTAIAVAQEPGNVNIDVNIGEEGGGAAWYSIWWVWVLIAMFIIVIVALTSRGRASE